jgi:hypothetical protein
MEGRIVSLQSSSGLHVTDPVYSFAAIGTLVIIAALATDPFVQQVVTYPTRLVDTEASGAVLRTLTYNGVVMGGATATTLNPSDDMRAAIFTGMYTEGTNVSPSCSTGNCTWPEYSSLAVCGTCNDITERIKIRRTTWDEEGYSVPYESCEMSLPNGVTLNYTNMLSPWYTLNFTQDTVVTPALAALQSTIMSFTTLFSRTLEGPRCGDPDADTEAVECSIYWCVQTYSTSITNSKLREHAHNPRSMLSLSDQTNALFYSLYLNESLANYTVLATVPASLQNFMRYGIMQSGNFSYDNYDSSSDMIRLLRAAASDSGAKGIAKSIATLTRSMTTSVRTAPSYPEQGPPVIGSLQQEIRFIHVRWPWLILQVGLDVLAIVFLLGVIVQTWRTGTEVWKSSQRAMIFRGLSTRDLMDVETTGRLVDMQQTAKHVYVKLQGSNLDAEDKRLVKVA